MTPRPGKSDHGFTLIEVLVAMLIFSFAVVGLLQAQRASLGTIAALDDRAYGEIVAENEMVRTMATEADLRLGFTTGEVQINGRTFVWQRGVFDGGLPGLRRIELNVRLKGGEQVLYDLTALKAEGR